MVQASVINWRVGVGEHLTLFVEHRPWASHLVQGEAEGVETDRI